MDKVFIRNLLTRGKIGISEKERSRVQDILINVEFFADLTHAGRNDCIEDCIDYSVKTKEILGLVEQNERRTLEALAADIADLCLAHPCVQRIRIRVEKTSAVRFVASVGVEIDRSK